jgi:cyclophilin family peptidyl-prolyl cis-trans isomerase/HEAT repeat protein
MQNDKKIWTVSGIVAFVLCGSVWSPAARPSAQGSPASLRAQILAAEDRRAPGDADLRVLTSALAHPDPAIQRLAVRALGRLERPSLISLIAPLLVSPDAGVRAEAANALAQAVPTSAGTGQANAAAATPVAAIAQAGAELRRQLGRETDPMVGGVICESLGRLPYRAAADAQAIEALLVAATFAPAAGSGSKPQDADVPALVRVVKGLESLLRQNAKIFTPAAATIDRLRTLAIGHRADRKLPSQLQAGAIGQPDLDDVARVRRLALLALAPHSDADDQTLRSAMDDEQWEVRRIAVRDAAAGLRAPDSATRSARLAIVMRGLGDAHWRVRYEALSALGRNQEGTECRVLLTAVADPSPHVSLLAVDLLPKCGPTSDAPRILGGLVRVLPPADGPWHRPAHAIVSLARLAPEQADAQLRRFAASPVWQVRVYAARAAAVAKSSDVLRTLAADTDDNVRTAAVSGLSEVEQHAADEVFISELARTDGQLLLTAARALKGTPDRARAFPALVRALGALTTPHRDTSRDARLALLERIGEVGGREQARTLEPYVRDPDPRVGASAAAILRQWTGVDRAVLPAASPAAAPPTLDDVRQLDGATAIVRMKSGATFTLALLTADAPASVVRFARLARAGYYNGLTFHRVEPGSLIQGGSPGANEYAGDGPFMRDEVGLASNRRASVGISTRGRDTGDAQFYINLVDNARYDHTYTVFATVERGMEVVDAILEGDTIEQVSIIERQAQD